MSPPLHTVLEQLGEYSSIFPKVDRRLLVITDTTYNANINKSLYHLQIIEDVYGGLMYTRIVTLYEPWDDLHVKVSDITKDQFDMLWNLYS